MIIGIGIDIVKTVRIKKILDKFGHNFEKRIFTESEISDANNKSNVQAKINYYAKRFAAKEAFSKAIGLGIGRGINFVDIEVINNKNGRPKIKLTTKSKIFLQKYLNHDSLKIDLSMTDETDIAQAIVIISKL